MFIFIALMCTTAIVSVFTGFLVPTKLGIKELCVLLFATIVATSASIGLDYILESNSLFFLFFSAIMFGTIGGKLFSGLLDLVKDRNPYSDMMKQIMICVNATSIISCDNKEFMERKVIITDGRPIITSNMNNRFKVDIISDIKKINEMIYITANTRYLDDLSDAELKFLCYFSENYTSALNEFIKDFKNNKERDFLYNKAFVSFVYLCVDFSINKEIKVD